MNATNARNDAETIRKIQNGERELFRELIEFYQGKIFAIAFASLRNRDLAEEAVQESFVNAYANLRGLRRPEKFGPWLCAITRRTTLSVLKKQKRCERDYSEQQRVNENNFKPSDDAHRREVADILHETLETLPPSLAETLTLFYFQEKSITQTAELLGVSENTVKTRLHRGRERLKKPLEKILTDELSNLKPSANLMPGIMAILPSISMKAPLPAIFASCLSLSLGSSIVIFGVATWWLQIHLFKRSFKNPDDYRSRLHHKDMKKIFPLMILSMSAGLILPLYLGMYGFLIVLGLFCIFGACISLPNDIRLWKVDNKLHLLRNLILMSIGLFYVSVVWLPQLNDFIMLPFLGFACIAWLTRSNNGKLMRQDMSLFLRAIQNELPRGNYDDENKNTTTTIPTLKRKEFACFLGKEMLVWGYKNLPGEISEIALAPVRNNMFITIAWNSLSKIHIDKNGNITAKLSQNDLAKLENIEKRQFTQSEISNLELQVAKAATSAAKLFLQENSQEVMCALSAVGENDIFKNGAFNRSPFARFQNIMIFIMMALLLTIITINLTNKYFD